MRRVVVTPEAIQRMRAEMKLAPHTETGGVLVGRIEHDNLVVYDASGPGPRAELRRRSILIDGEFAAKFCAQVRRESGGEIDYIGDWHCHLACSYKPSETDYLAMETMADFDSAPTRTPISLIWAKYRGAFATYLFTEDRELKRIPRRILRGLPE